MARRLTLKAIDDASEWFGILDEEDATEHTLHVTAALVLQEWLFICDAEQQLGNPYLMGKKLSERIMNRTGIYIDDGDISDFFYALLGMEDKVKETTLRKLADVGEKYKTAVLGL